MIVWTKVAKNIYSCHFKCHHYKLYNSVFHVRISHSRLILAGNKSNSLELVIENHYESFLFSKTKYYQYPFTA